MSSAVFSNSFDANYTKALSLSLEFYDAQGAGARAESWRRVHWRKASALDDGSDVNIDLSGGWFDAGDHVKFSLPMSYSATMLSWGFLEYKTGFTLAEEEAYFKNNLKVALDYFLQTYQDNGTADISDDILYYQVGNPGSDHSFWGPPELMDMDRPTYSCDKEKRCSEVAGGVVAAMAAGSMVFNSNTAYSNRLLEQAKKLYEFATTYQGNNGYTAANGFYQSFSGYNDEFAWAAIWLYKATGTSSYLSDAKNYVAKASSALYWAHNWDNVSNGTYLLLAKSGDSSATSKIQTHLDYWINGVSRTDAGLAHLSEWGSLRYASTTAFLAFVYSDWVSDATLKLTYSKFAVEQMSYILGNNPLGISYEIGVGDKYPINPHHRAAHASATNNINSPINNTYLLKGALVGGPKSANDFDYSDDRDDYIRNEVATDYNAGFTGALAKMAIINPTTTQVTPATPTTTPTTTPTNPIGVVSVVRQRTDEWSTGFCEDVTITNTTSQPQIWQVTLDTSKNIYYSADVKIEDLNGTKIAKGLDYNNAVPSNGQVFFKYCAGEEKQTTTTTQPATTVSTPTTLMQDGLQITRVRNSDWESGYCESIDIYNSNDINVVWNVELEVEGSIYNLWNANYTQSGTNLQASGVEWNALVASKKSVSFGFCANKSAAPMQQSVKLFDVVKHTLSQSNTPELDASGNLEITRIRGTDWGSGYCDDVYIKNISDTNIVWEVTLDYEGEIYTIWNVTYSTTGGKLTASGVDWNTLVNAGAEVSFGFCANR